MATGVKVRHIGKIPAELRVVLVSFQQGADSQAYRSNEYGADAIIALQSLHP
jgi:hypothetical protein